MPSIDGEWTVVYASLDGKQKNKGVKKGTISNNVVTCNDEGKQKTWKLQFGPNNMVRSTDMSEGGAITTDQNRARDANDRSRPTNGNHTRNGVYIAAPDYLCLSLVKNKDGRESAHPQSVKRMALFNSRRPKRTLAGSTTHRFGNGPDSASRQLRREPITA